MRADRRNATHVLMISLSAQLDLIEALVQAGALTASAAAPLAASIWLRAGAWSIGHEDIAGDLPARAEALAAKLRGVS